MLFEAIAEYFERVVARLLEHLVAIVAAIEHTDLSQLPELAKYLADRLVLQLINNDPTLIEASLQFSRSLGELAVDDYRLLGLATALCLAISFAAAGPMLAVKAIFGRRQLVFVSFNHHREGVALRLQRALERAHAGVFRIPFQVGASHQQVLTRAVEGIRQCDAVVCIPGSDASFVEQEVIGATMANKPIVFLVSEAAGTLPNTADKRYPVFKLEVTERAHFRPLIDFLSYIGADLRSTWGLCRAALSHPFMSVSIGVAATCFFCALVVLWGWCYVVIARAGTVVAKALSNGQNVVVPVVIAHSVVLGLVGLILLPVCCFSLLFVLNWVRQLRARARSRLKTAAAQFDREDWVGVAQTLSRDGSVYECMFDTAPRAHHEPG